jgi:hypothetical protein
MLAVAHKKIQAGDKIGSKADKRLARRTATDRQFVAMQACGQAGLEC